MGQIDMRNSDLDNFVGESINHARYGRYESQSGVKLHRWEIYPTQSGMLYL